MATRGRGVLAAITDPRLREDGLGMVTRALFGDDRLLVDTGVASPTGMVAALRYVVVPSLREPRILLPLAGRRVQVASLLAYNQLRAPAVRRSRAALAALIRVSPTLLGRLPVLTVWAPVDLTLADALISEQVAATLGTQLYAAIGVHSPDPNAKPTLQLFDASAAPRAYVKVGWNDATRRLVATEAAALRDAPSAVDYPIVPEFMAAGQLGGRTFVVAAPLPVGVRGMPVTAAPELSAMLAVARRGTGPTQSAPLHSSQVAARLTGEVAGVLAAHRDVELEFGAWHGDWVPWNLGRHDGRVVAWDWEHSGACMPVGSDLVHHAFQMALTLRGDDAARAADASAQALAANAGALGLAPSAVPAVVDIYLAELWLRTARLAAGGAGWNSRLHPALLEVLASRRGGARPTTTT